MNLTTRRIVGLTFGFRYARYWDVVLAWLTLLGGDDNYWTGEDFEDGTVLLLEFGMYMEKVSPLVCG